MATYEDFINEQAGIDRNRRIAEMLMQQGAQPLEMNQVAGGYVVPVSPLSAINKIAQQLSGAYIGRKASDRESALTNAKLAAFKDIDFSNPNVANKIAQIDPSKGIDYALKLAEARMPKTATPGMGYIPAGYEPITDERGNQWFKGPTGDLIADRFGLSQYQQYQTDPAQRAAVAGAEAEARGRKKPVEYTDIEGRQDVAPAEEFPGYNPGNIRPEGQTQGFQSYATPEEGLKAIDDNLKAYGTKHGINTLSGVINRWSPSSENDTEQLIANASQRLGVDPNQEIDLTDPVQRQAIATAITMQENPIFGRGVRPQSKAEALTTEEAIKNKAKIEAKRNEQAFSLPKVKSSADYAKKLVDEITIHPGLSKSVGGWSMLRLSSIPGTQQANFKARLDQLGGKTFLEAFETLKGGGQITEIEGQKATAAIARLSTTQDETEFKNSLNELKSVIDNASKNAYEMAGKEQPKNDDKEARINALKQRHGLQ